MESELVALFALAGAVFGSMWGYWASEEGFVLLAGIVSLGARIFITVGVLILINLTGVFGVLLGTLFVYGVTVIISSVVGTMIGYALNSSAWWVRMRIIN